jgi:hypothetical protein
MFTGVINQGPIDSISEPFDSFIKASDVIIEEGIVLGRVLVKMEIPDGSVEVSAVNDISNQYQYIWCGQYRVKLDRGLGIPYVYCMGRFGRGAHDQGVIPTGEKINVMWLSRNSQKIPFILDGVSLEFLSKQILGYSALLDSGEKIIRSAISEAPEITAKSNTGAYPFFDNQHDNPQTMPDSFGSFDENS